MKFLTNLVDNTKTFYLDSSKILTKLTKRTGEYSVMSQITKHGDTAILDYDGPENGKWRHCDRIVAGYAQIMDNSFSGLDQYDITPFIAIFNDASSAATADWYIYYPCTYGLGQKLMNNNQFQSFLQRANYSDLDHCDNALFPVNSGYRTVYIKFINHGRQTTMYIQEQEGDTFTKQSDNSVTFGDPEKIGIRYVDNAIAGIIAVIDSTPCNIWCAADIIALYNSAAILEVSQNYELYDISSSLSTAVSDIEALSETTDELVTQVRTLNDRVSAIESETISKYVSR